MIKFFRKIRHRLLSENKFSKYLLYAIGEIILVVIGILIALQINNWNENRKLEKSKHKLMLAIKKELTTNKAKMETYLTELHECNTKFNQLVRFSVGDYEITTDSLKYYLSGMVYGRTLSIFNSVREEAINSGKFELLSDSLKQSLSLLKDYTDSRNSIQNKSIDLISYENDLSVDELIASLYMTPVVPDELTVQPKIPVHPEYSLEGPQLVNLVKKPETYLTLNRIYFKHVADEVWVKHGLIAVTDKTIKLIDKELNEQ